MYIVYSIALHVAESIQFGGGGLSLYALCTFRGLSTAVYLILSYYLISSETLILWNKSCQFQTWAWVDFPEICKMCVESK